MARHDKRRRDGLVWDSHVGSVCPGCGQPVATCACAAAAPGEPRASGDGVVRVALDRKGRHGKAVTVVRGLPGSAAELARLAAEWKKRCGAGGAVADGCIEIQGDRRDVLVEELRKRGFTVKRAGG